MPRRIIEVNGEPWEVAVSGRSTQYTKDEFGLVFSRGTGRGPGAARRALHAARRQEPRAVAEPAERPGAAGAAVPFATVLDRARDGVPPLTTPDLPPPARLVDLHIHSTASDGSLPPERSWSARGGRVSRPWRSPITTPWPACPAALAAGARIGIRVVGGCEFSSAAPWGEMHVLGYFLPSKSAELESFLERCRADRVRRGPRDGDPASAARASRSNSTTCCGSRTAARWGGRTWRAPS